MYNTYVCMCSLLMIEIPSAGESHRATLRREHVSPSFLLTWPMAKSSHLVAREVGSGFSPVVLLLTWRQDCRTEAHCHGCWRRNAATVLVGRPFLLSFPRESRAFNCRAHAVCSVRPALVSPLVNGVVSGCAMPFPLGENKSRIWLFRRRERCAC